jgi:hypothetical protein
MRTWNNRVIFLEWSKEQGQFATRLNTLHFVAEAFSILTGVKMKRTIRRQEKSNQRLTCMHVTGREHMDAPDVLPYRHED